MEEIKTKIEAFKNSRTELGLDSFRSLPLDGVRAKIEVGNDRIIKGYAIVWNTINSHREIVLKGATLNSLNARGIGSTKNSIAFLKHHKPENPIAKLLILREDDYGLYFEAEIIRTALGDETIEEINSEVLRQISYGFNYVWDKTDYDDNLDAFILREIKLYEISLVTFSSDENAQLRTFKDYQKDQIFNNISSQQLRSIIALASTELKSRDEHSDSNEEEEQVSKSNVKLF